MGVLMRRAGRAVRARSAAGEADPLPPLAIQYADYAAWQRQWLAGERAAGAGGRTGKTALAGAPALLELPTDRPRPAQQDYAGGVVRLVLDAELTRGAEAR